MKINDITVNESTTSGAIATVASPMTSQKRGGVGKGVYANEKPGSLLTGKKTSKKYANSVNENFSGENVTVVYIDGKPALKYTSINDAKKAVELMQKKHPKKNFEIKSEVRGGKGGNDKLGEVREAKLDEEDLIIVPGQGHKKGGFISRADDRRDHEVEMARGDLYQAYKNAKSIHELIKDTSEDDGLEGWVQAKITKAADYLNSVRQYLEGKKVQEMTGGVIAGGGVGEAAGQKYEMRFTNGKTQRFVAATPEEAKKKAKGLGATSLIKVTKDGMPKGKVEEEQLSEISKKTAMTALDKAWKQDLRVSPKKPNMDPFQDRGPGIEDKILAKWPDMLNHIMRKSNVEYGDDPDNPPKKKIRKNSSPGIKMRNAAAANGFVPATPGVASTNEGAKVDRMVKHIEKSERDLGKSKDKASDIAWATANKRGMLDNKNKKG